MDSSCLIHCVFLIIFIPIITTVRMFLCLYSPPPSETLKILKLVLWLSFLKSLIFSTLKYLSYYIISMTWFLRCNIVLLHNLAAVEDLHTDLTSLIEFFIFRTSVDFFPLINFKLIVWIVFLISLNCLHFISWVSFSFLIGFLLNYLSEYLLKSYFNCIALDTLYYLFPYFECL